MARTIRVSLYLILILSATPAPWGPASAALHAQAPAPAPVQVALAVVDRNPVFAREGPLESSPSPGLLRSSTAAALLPTAIDSDALRRLTNIELSDSPIIRSERLANQYQKISGPNMAERLHLLSPVAIPKGMGISVSVRATLSNLYQRRVLERVVPELRKVSRTYQVGISLDM